MRDEQLKLQLSRFVAVLPYLHRSAELVEHPQEYSAVAMRTFLNYIVYAMTH